MPQINHQQTIHAPIDLVYEISQDYSVRYDWDAFPDYIRNLDGADGMPFVGREVEIRSKLGMTMRVRFVQVKPPECAAVKMFQALFFIEQFAGSWVFQKANETETVARFCYSLSAPKWCAFWLNPLMIKYFSFVAERRLLGLKKYCEQRFQAA